MFNSIRNYFGPFFADLYRDFKDQRYKIVAASALYFLWYVITFIPCWLLYLLGDALRLLALSIQLRPDRNHFDSRFTDQYADF